MTKRMTPLTSWYILVSHVSNYCVKPILRDDMKDNSWKAKAPLALPTVCLPDALMRDVHYSHAVSSGSCGRVNKEGTDEKL